MIGSEIARWGNCLCEVSERPEEGEGGLEEVGGRPLFPYAVCCDHDRF